MKRFFYLFFLILLLSGVVNLKPSNVQADDSESDTGWAITHFDSAIMLDKTGDLLVTETISVDFANLSKHGIYRDLPLLYRSKTSGEPNRAIKLSHISALANGQQIPLTIENNTVTERLKIGEPKQTVSGTQVYTIYYQVTGALLTSESADQIKWNVTGSNWPVAINEVSVHLFIPDGKLSNLSCFAGEIGTTKGCEKIEQPNPSKADFSLITPLQPSQQLTVVADYPKNLVPVTVIPAPKSFSEILGQWSTLWLVLFSFVLSLSFAIKTWLKSGRDQEADNKPVPFGYHPAIIAEYEPPAGLRPGEMGVLIDEKADTIDMTATIVDLACRGYLKIKELPKKWAFGSTDYQFIKTDTSTKDLYEYEKILYNGFFKEKNEVLLSSLKMTYYTELEKAKQSLYQQVVADKLFITNPAKVRLKYTIITVLILIVAIGLSFAGATINSGYGAMAYLSVLGICLFVTAFPIGFMIIAMPSRSVKGTKLYRQTLGFRLFLDKVEKYRAQFAEKENFFNEILPYAIVFGLTKKLAKALVKLGIQTTAPNWYYGVGPYNALVFADSMNNFQSSLSTAMASAPNSGGGGGAGGGFGGGGGGSW